MCRCSILSRAELLSDELDLLHDRDCEVMVACMPSRDALRASSRPLQAQRPSTCCSPMRKWTCSAHRGTRSSDPASTIAPAWPRRHVRKGVRTRSARGVLVRRAWRGASGRPELLPLFVMASLGKGTFEDVAAFGPFGPDQDALLAEQYPYLGIDSRSGRFEAAPFDGRSPRRRVCAQAGRRFGADRSVVLRCEHARRALGRCARDARRARNGACDFVRLLASRAPRASWLAKHGAALLEAACLVPACEVQPLLIGRDERGRALCSAPTRRFAARFWGIDKRPALPRARRCATGTRRPPCQIDGRVGARAMRGSDERRRADQHVVSLLAAAGIADAAEAPREAVCAKAPEDRGWLAA